MKAEPRNRNIMSREMPDWMNRDQVNQGKMYKEYLKEEYGKYRSKTIEHFLTARGGIYL